MLDPKSEPESMLDTRPNAEVESLMQVEPEESSYVQVITDFYHEDRMVVLETRDSDKRGRVIHSRYKFNLASLKLHAPVLVRYLVHELGLNKAVGGTEKDPVVLPFTSQEFTNFMNWIHDREWRPFQSNESNLVDLLEVASHLHTEDGVSYAVDGLTGLRLPPARMLELVDDYRRVGDVHAWLGPAVKALIQRPLGEISPEEEKQILSAYPTIAKTRESIRALLTYLARTPIPLTLADKDQGPFSDLCPNHGACIENWRSRWIANVGGLLLDANKPPTYKEFLEVLESAPFPLVNPACKTRMLKWLRTKNDFPGMQKLIEEAVSSVENIYGIPASVSQRADTPS
ncbi:hypothetical protein F5878DRAFT_661064 [Lentinula raphanica]|uniref:BTB domain-containing protein n=1 Tax=Lentinula raphanica TaxID=153919 RepID=A0AA38UHL3_9AGAR|nr:hypothetical protein F5878DRAFT_661064 [Lentinula raphanica]